MAASCVIVGSFKRECISTAYDLKAGTPGFGWAIGPDKAKANERALAACQATAGEDRRAFCQLLTSKCDARD